MDKITAGAFNENILKKILKKYWLCKEDINYIGGFQNYIYEYKKDSNYILRISHSSRRTFEQIKAEVEWINYLAENEVSVSYAIPSAKNNLVEVIEAENSYFCAVSFIKAEGGPPEKKDWNNKLFYNVGKLVGRMHILTKEYNPSNSSYTRPNAFEEMNKIGDNYLDKDDEMLVSKYNQILKYPEKFNKDEECYGLIHCDIHQGNYFVKNGKITLFDFDDCGYSWFVEDIAMCLFYAVFPGGLDRKTEEKASEFYYNFMEGYITENIIEDKWLKEMPYFFKQRELFLYIVLMASNYNAEAFMKDRRYKIKNNIPYINIDYV